MNAADAIAKSVETRDVVVIAHTDDLERALESVKRWSGKYDRGDWTIREYRGSDAQDRDWRIKLRTERE